jgi:hypothetical protein
MKNKFTPTAICRAAIFALAALFTLQAAPFETIHWKELAARLNGRLLTITTKDGRSLHSRNFVVVPNGISIVDGTPTLISRDTVLSLHWESPDQSETRKLGKSLSGAYRHSGRLLGTELGPIALAELPLITAWGAAAVPFCLLGDLFAPHRQTSGDISILPDSFPAVSK